MSYIDSSLGQSEVLHYRARFHWFYHAAAWGALVIAAVVAMLAFAADAGWIAVAALIAGGVIWLMILLPIWTTEIGVTNQRVIYKRGLVQRDTNELQLRSIEEVRFVQDFWGRIFGFGKIEIHGTGDDAIFLPAVADPIELRAALQDSIGNAQGDPPPVSAQDPGQNGIPARPA